LFMSFYCVIWVMEKKLVTQPSNRRQPAVIKANSLIEAKYKLSAREQKVLLFLISKLDSQNISNPIYETHVDEIMQVLSESGIKWGDAYTYFTEIIMLLKSKPISIYSEGEIVMANWLGTVSLVEKSGVVKYSFDSLISPFLFEIKKNFTKYPLRHIIKLRSTYSIRMYELLKQYARIGERKFDLVDLRELLGIEEDLYPRFYDFDKRVLKPAQKELEKYTDISFTYKKIKYKRNIVALLFTMHMTGDTSGTTEQRTLPHPTDKASIASAAKTEREQRLVNRLKQLQLDDWQVQRIMQQVGDDAQSGIWDLINTIKMDKRDGRIRDSLGGYTARKFDQKYQLGFFKS